MRKIFFLLFITFVLIGTTKAQNLPVVLEAENGQLGTDFEVVEEDGVTYVRPATDYIDGAFPGDASKVITFSVPFVETGNYEIYVKLRVGGESYSDDSFFFGKSFGDTSATDGTVWHIANGLVPVGHNVDSDFVTAGGSIGNLEWKWINISEYVGGDSPIIYSVDDVSEPKIFCIGSRENGLDIDKIAFGKADLFYSVRSLELVEAGTKLETTNNDTSIPEDAYQVVRTFVNPVLTGDHPDLTLFKKGDDFYSCGSCFHFIPYLPILHSTDLVHWEEICRVIPTTWSGILDDGPAGGTWGGAITYFYGSYWIYFSNTAGGGQYFCKADNPAGPWTTPVKVKTTSTTGPIGYDNSVFVDDDGTPYMLLKNGQYINRIQEIGQDGHLTKEVINLDFINADGKYSWAEGPVMCKRDGWYYYFMAGNVMGGQYVARSKTLTDDPNSWEHMGNFFANVTDSYATFRSPNHIGQPFQLADGTWWTISHSYETQGGNDWSGQGRQGLLHQIVWDLNGKPTGLAPTSTPQLKPNLSKSGIDYKLPRSDYFEDDSIKLSWHFLNRRSAGKYSLTEKPGWLTLIPGSGQTHILHKEARHHFAIVTKVSFDATAKGQEAGIYLTNGNESVTAQLFTGYTDAKKIGFRFNGNTTEIDNPYGNELWLKVERFDHQLKAFYSANGLKWNQIGATANVSSMDKSQPNYNSWVGTSNGLYAAKLKAYFDMYAFKDGFSELPIIGYNNYFGLETKGSGINKTMTNSSEKGGWAMLGGVDLGQGERIPVAVQVEASSTQGGQLEVWFDDIENDGVKVATIDISSTGSDAEFNTFKAAVNNLSGQHDIYLRWVGAAKAFQVKNLRFVADESFYTGNNSIKNVGSLKAYPNPFMNSFTIETSENNTEYSIFSIDGRLMESGRIDGNKQHLGENLEPGLYLLQSTANDKTETVKINKIK